MSGPLRLCLICHFAIENDDLVTPSGPTTAICLRCFERETGGTMRVPTRMEREVAGVLAGIQASGWLKDE